LSFFLFRSKAYCFAAVLLLHVAPLLALLCLFHPNMPKPVFISVAVAAAAAGIACLGFPVFCHLSLQAEADGTASQCQQTPTAAAAQQTQRPPPVAMLLQPPLLPLLLLL
jgi:hypothetical protein